MARYFMDFSSFLDTSPALTPKNYDENTKFKIEKIEGEVKEEGVIVIKIQYLKDKVFQIFKPGHSLPFKVFGNLPETRKDGQDLMQELARNPDMKMVLRDLNLTDIFQYLSAESFYKEKF